MEPFTYSHTHFLWNRLHTIPDIFIEPFKTFVMETFTYSYEHFLWNRLRTFTKISYEPIVIMLMHLYAAPFSKIEPSCLTELSSRKHTYIILTPQTPLLYSKNWGLLEYILFFIFLLKYINCGYSLEPPRRGGSNECPKSMFWADIWKNIRIFIWKFLVFGGEIFNIFEQACFRNVFLI